MTLLTRLSDANSVSSLLVLELNLTVFKTSFLPCSRSSSWCANQHPIDGDNDKGGDNNNMMEEEEDTLLLMLHVQEAASADGALCLSG